MTLLIIYVLIALGFSFLCSIAESVILSVTPAYVALLRKKHPGAGAVLEDLKAEISKPLAAILTLNTIAHTVGAAGAGAQATAVFGNAYLGVASAVMTLLILIFSEIIPKTLGAHYWRQLAPATAYLLKWLVWVLYPFVKLSEWITGGMTEGPTLSGFSRQEFAAMAELSAREGEIGEQESRVMRNVLALRRTPVSEIMTPRTVVFSVPGDTTVEAFFAEHQEQRFSRIPVYAENPDQVTGFVLRSDLLLEKTRGHDHNRLNDLARELPALAETVSVERAFRLMHSGNAHLAMVVDEYGDLQGIVTLEDIMETLLGLEIVDEGDDDIDMRRVAEKKWRERARSMGVDPEKLREET